MRISLSEWETFYVITGSSAAALTGIMFVVVALVADRGVRRPSEGVGAFSTPTVGHFAFVLLLASIMTMPLHRVLSLGLCIGGCAVAGLTSSAVAGLRMRKVVGYTPEKVDWAWHVIIPFVTYMVLLVGAFLLGIEQEIALGVVAVVALGLIFIGIHNAWDVALYIVTQPAEKAVPREATVPLPAVTPSPVATATTARSDAPGSLSPS